MPNELAQNPVYLGRGGRVDREPDFTGDMQWYADMVARHQGDGADGFLLSQHTFSASWDMWERHPNGHEVVLCVAGELTLVQEVDGEQRRQALRPGEYAINEPGVWHTADVLESATAVFVTAGIGTEHRPR